MIPQNLHTHTVFDDGTATVMDMARAALDAGLTSLGFSGHSTLPYRDNWEIKPGRMPAYLAAVTEAKDAFRGRLSIYSGLELDSTSAMPEEHFDYIIGSIHHIVKDGQYLSIDYKPAISRDILMYALNTLSHCYIVGHVHDEIIIEAPMNASTETICEQMGRTPPWIPGLLLRADGYETMFYKKD